MAIATNQGQEEHYSIEVEGPDGYPIEAVLVPLERVADGPLSHRRLEQLGHDLGLRFLSDSEVQAVASRGAELPPSRCYNFIFGAMEPQESNNRRTIKGFSRRGEVVDIPVNGFWHPVTTFVFGRR